MAAGPLKVRTADELLYRHWTSWREGRFTHVLLVDAESGKVVRDLTPGRWDSPTFAVGGGGGFAFSPDGRELCFVSNHDRDQARSTNSDLWVVAVDAETVDPAPVNITKDERRVGRRSGLLAGRPVHRLPQPGGAGYESDLYRIGLYDRRTRKTRYLTDRENFDNWINDLRWSPDSKALFFSGDEAGETPSSASG